jgi:hypothetical protein
LQEFVSCQRERCVHKFILPNLRNVAGLTAHPGYAQAAIQACALPGLPNLRLPP